MMKNVLTIIVLALLMRNAQAQDAVAIVEIKDKWHYMKPDGALLFEEGFKEARPFSEGVAIVEIQEKFVVIDQTGKHLFAAPYLKIRDFSDGLAAVRKGDFWGF